MNELYIHHLEEELNNDQNTLKQKYNILEAGMKLLDKEKKVNVNKDYEIQFTLEVKHLSGMKKEKEKDVWLIKR